MAGLVSSGSMLHKLRSSSIEEILAKQVDTMIPALDEFGKSMVQNSKGEIPVANLGRDYLYISHFQPAQASGLLRPTSAKNDAYLFGETAQRYGGANGRMFRQTVTNTLPQPDDTQPLPIRFAIGLRGIEGAMQFTWDELQLAANSAVLGPTMIANKMKGHARTVAQFYINAWWTDPAENYKLTALGASTGSSAYSLDSTNRLITFTPVGKEYDRLMPGQPVDIFPSTSSTARVNQYGGNRVRVVVSSVDAMYGKVVLAVEPSTAALPSFTDIFNTTTIGETAILVEPGNYDAANAAFNGIAGANAWIKQGDSSGATNTDANCLLGADRVEQGTFGGAVNVNTHPEFKSLIKDIGDTMTEHKFRLILDQFYRHHGKYGNTVDTAVWSVGALRGYEQTKTGQVRLEHSATGQLSGEGAADALTFKHDGRTYKFKTSNSITAGQCYIVKASGGNMQRILPPYAAGAKSAPFGDEGLGLPIRLMLPALTGNNTVLSQNASGQHLAATSMPYLCYMQWKWKQPASIKLTGITEDREDA